LHLFKINLLTYFNDYLFDDLKVPEKLLSVTMIEEFTIILKSSKYKVDFPNFVVVIKSWVIHFKTVKKFSLVIKLFINKQIGP